MPRLFARASGPILRSFRPSAPLLRLPGAYRLASNFQNQPSPPRLPAEQQAEFERLQRAAEAELHTHTQIPACSGAAAAAAVAPSSELPKAAEADQTTAGTMSGGMRQGAPPEFEGDTNPNTGEVGGPKNEPLRWGSQGDWSFNGRVTDF